MRSTKRRFSEFLRWHLEPFVRPQEDPGATLTELLVREEDQDETPEVYSYLRWREVVYRSPSFADVARYALWDIHHQATQNVRSFLALHAGAVATAQGSLILPGPMESGKSTLVAALLRAGWGYLSDEVAALDPITGRAHPFPKHLYLDQDSVDMFPGLGERLADRDERSRGRLDRTIRSQDLDAAVAGPVALRAIVFLGRDRVGPARLLDMPGGEAVLQMAANCFNLHRYGERGVEFLSRVARDAVMFRLEGGGPMERADLLTRSFGERSLSR